jgi:hypothetical protein
MKLIKNPASHLGLALFCLSLAGCESHKSVARLGSGYEEVTHLSRFSSGDEAELARISLQYRGTDGKIILVWPSLYGVKGVVKGDLAIFVGDRAYKDEDSKETRPRLFAVKAPEMPLDITDEVLWRWSKASGREFTKTLQSFSLVIPVETSGGLELQLEFSSEDKDWPDKAVLQLDWNQLSDILHRVKEKGVVEKDLQWHTSFIGEKF